LTIIGKSWLEAKPSDGRRRLDDPSDYVRIEIEQAFASGLHVIPALVGHAEMPTSLQLPESLRILTKHNAISIRPDPDFHRDVDRLVLAAIFGALSLIGTSSLYLFGKSGDTTPTNVALFIFCPLAAGLVCLIHVLILGTHDFNERNSRPNRNVSRILQSSVIYVYIYLEVPPHAYASLRRDFHHQPARADDHRTAQAVADGCRHRHPLLRHLPLGSASGPQ